MVIHQISISKSKLEAIPESERAFFVLLGHFLNEISILNKLLLFVKMQTHPGVERKAQVTQALLLARMFIGKVFEGWEMLNKEFFGAALSMEYVPRMKPPGDSALVNLKRYFGKSNLLNKIRNEFSFHYSSEKIKQKLVSLDDSYKSEIYLADNYANSLNWMCEEIVSHAMLETVGIEVSQQALDKVMGDLTKVSGWFFDFCGSCLYITVERYLGRNLSELNAEEIIVSPVQMETVTLPYFVSRDK